MTITTARKRFEFLKEKILKDGKIDYAETEVLLEFIEPYVRSHNHKFTEFAKIIYQTQKDNVITEEESEMLIREIENISEFLNTESKIETFITGFLGLGLIFLICLKIFS